MSAGLAAELCYTEAVRLRPCLPAIRRYWPTAELADGTSRGGGYMVAFPELIAPGPIRLMVAFGRSARLSTPDRRDLSQTWAWDDAAKVMAAVTHTLTVTEIFGTSFAPADRVRALTAVVRALTDETAPAGIWWPASTLATPPDAERPGVFNVRMHDTTASPATEGRGTRAGELVLDTLGLAPLGLPDLQVLCGALPPASIAGYLVAAASHLIDGHVMRPGDTVQGLTPHQRWRVKAGSPLAGPDRPTLTIIPGTA